jgi:hypothetical protein
MTESLTVAERRRVQAFWRGPNMTTGWFAVNPSPIRLAYAIMRERM